MRVLAVPHPRILLALCIALAAAAFSAVALKDLYRALAPPIEVYDNERAILALIWGAFALPLSLVSLALVWRLKGQAAGWARFVAAAVLILLIAGVLAVTFLG